MDWGGIQVIYSRETQTEKRDGQSVKKHLQSLIIDGFSIAPPQNPFLLGWESETMSYVESKGKFTVIFFKERNDEN